MILQVRPLPDSWLESNISGHRVCVWVVVCHVSETIFWV